MKLKNYLGVFVLIVFVLCGNLQSIAQTSISGTVIEKTKSTPLQGVSILLLNTNDSTKTVLTTDKSGTFTKTMLPKGKYKLSTNYLGYKNEQQDFELLDKPKHFSFRLEPSEIIIEEVELLGPQAITLKGDTMEFDAKNFSTRDYAESDELVSQIPGIIIDEEGNVTAHGEQVTKIIVDGKEFFSTDPKIALKSLPADIIAKIQIIDEKSDQSRFSGVDDGKKNKVINIVTKPDKRTGKFGKASIGKGNSDKYGINFALNGFDQDKKFAINLMANNINETNFAEQGRGGTRRGNNNTERGLSDTYAGAINYSNSFLNKKMELSTDYNFRSLNTLTNSISDIEYLSEKQANQLRHQELLSDNIQKEHKFNTRIKWEMDSLNRLDFSPNFSYNKGGVHSNSISETFRQMTNPINKSDRSNENTSNNHSIGGSISFMHRFNKKGRTISFNIGGNYNSNQETGLNLALTSYFKNASISRIDTNNNNSLTNGFGSGINSRISIAESISTNSRLQANYNFRNTANYSDRETFEFLAETGQLGNLKERLSNEFRNDFNYHSAGISYVYNKKDSLRIQIGANYQHGIRINDRIVPINLKTTANFNSILPEFSVTYKIKNDKHFELNYNTQTITPNINQLQDFVNNQNELRITNGNPNLNQEYTHSVRFQYKDINKISGKSLTTNFSVDIINDKIVNSVFMTDTSLVLFDDITLGAGGQYSAPINVNGAYSARLNNSYGIPIKKWKINAQSNTRLYFNNDLAKINNDLVNSNSYGFMQTIGINSNFSKQFIINLGYTIDGRVTKNPLATVKYFQVLNHRMNNNISVEISKKIVLSSHLMYLFNGGIMEEPGIKTTIWNASVGYKLLNKKNAEISIKGYDLLNNAQNINRRVNENNISNTVSNTLTRYFLLSLTYNLRQFGSKANNNSPTN